MPPAVSAFIKDCPSLAQQEPTRTAVIAAPALPVRVLRLLLHGYAPRWGPPYALLQDTPRVSIGPLSPLESENRETAASFCAIISSWTWIGMPACAHFGPGTPALTDACSRAFSPQAFIAGRSALPAPPSPKM